MLCIVFSQSVVAQSTFANPAGIIYSFSSDELSPASPYPSVIRVSDLTGAVSKVTVTINRLDLGSPPDFDILLVGPSGQSAILISDAQGDWTGHIINMTLTFDDAAPSPLPSDRTLTSGTYKPTNFDSDADLFLPPAPGGPYGATLSAFNGTNPNGTWSLYVVRDRPGHFLDDGPPDPVIISSWSLTVTTQGSNTFPNPIEDAAFFVAQHYRDFLNREPEQNGLDAWLGILNRCLDIHNDPSCDRIIVSASFFNSPEFHLKGYFVFRFYRVALNRLPTYDEIASDMQGVTGQTPDAVYARKVTFANSFTWRQEFFNSVRKVIKCRICCCADGSLPIDQHRHS